MSASVKAPDAWIPQDAREWYDWLVEEERKTVAAYCDKPSLLIADYRRERDIARDYEGREVLELLQNANDQAAERGERGKVLIELAQHGLLVANSGLAFSVGGVRSLQTSHLSPKLRSGTKLIGSKGLGFRAVLNWTRTPMIRSQALSIAYCEAHARRKLEALVRAYPDLALAVMEERRTEDEVILPLLPFPLFSEDANLAPILADERARNSFARCSDLLCQGYDTVIAMPFSRPHGYAGAEAQIRQMGPEILLFAQHLGELSFRIGPQPEVTWRRDGDDALTKVLANGKPLGQWRVNRQSGKLPQDVAKADQSDATDFELVVALPQGDTPASPVLYSHFPTDITLPLALVCHATLELEQNRKHVQQKRACNEFVIGRLAEFIARIAEDAAANAGDDAWAGCALLIPTGDYPEELKREKFPQTLIASAKTRKIIPTLSGTPAAAASVRTIPGANADWLPAEVFPEVVPIRSAEDLHFLRSLGAEPLPVPHLKNRLIKNRKKLTLEQHVALVVGLLAQPKLEPVHSSALLLDSAGEALDDDVRVFLAPSGGETPTLPHWAKLRFLNPVLREKLAKRLRVRDARELQQKLSGFGLLEYSLGNVVSGLVAEANRAAKARPEQAGTFQADLLRTLFDLYVAEDPKKKRPDYPEGSPVDLPDQQGGSTAATLLYLGSGFGPLGEITQGLYAPWAKEKLLDPGRLPTQSTEPDKLLAFLLWLGVSRWPRRLIEKQPDRKYLAHALRSIVFPASFEDKVVPTRSHASGANVQAVQSIDGLDHILGAADGATIAAWLARDDRAVAWSRQAPDHALLLAKPGGVNNVRTYDGAVPSYVRWRIETTPWLGTGTGAMARPRDCVLGERAIEDLFPRPAMPVQEVLARFGLQPADMVEGWRRAGVLTSLAYLERDEVYAKLLELPERNPEGTLARPLYHWLLDASETALGGDGPNQKEFLGRGKMWGRHAGKADYYPVAQLHHADAEGLPGALLEKLKIVDLRKRAGSGKVERLFGVKPVDQVAIDKRIVDKEVAPRSSEAGAKFEEAKPYLHALRVQNSEPALLQRLKDLRLEVCSTLRLELTFEETKLQYDVPIWQCITQGDELYVRSDPARPLALSDTLLSEAIGDALAALFRLAGGGDFARMLACPEEDRSELLRRLRGDAALADIDSIKAGYASFSSRGLGIATFPLAPPPNPSQAVPAGGGGLAAPATEPVPNPPQEERPLEIQQIEHVPQPHGESRKLQVRSISSSGGGTGGGAGKPVTDGDFCESKAMEFEGASDPPRWAVPVGQIRGSAGPKCDLLSFATQEGREAFLQNPKPDLALVARFIEVKGRGSASATIELKGNALEAAELYGDRYFLYRLFEADDGTFELCVLSNPLMQKEALRPAVHVGLDQAKATQRFALSGGMQPKRPV